MKLRWIIAASLLALVSRTSYATDPVPGPVHRPQVRYGLEAVQKKHERTIKRQQKQNGAHEKTVDINHASLSELKTLPGIGDAEAAKIVAGRPYKSKSWLVTHHVINGGIYEGIKRRVVAGGPDKATEQPVSR